MGIKAKFLLIDVRMKNNSDIDKVLVAYFFGQANADEIKKLMGWLDQSPTNKAHFDNIQDYLKTSHYKISTLGQDSAYSRIHKKIFSENPVIRRTIPIHSPKRFFTWAKGLAATFLILSVAFYYFMYSTSDHKVVTDTSPAMMKFGNKPGQKSRIMLPDGSRVVLNSGSAIEYPERFNDSERLVRLEGEAFFEVAKDELKPFKVTSGNITTTAMGTSFNIQSYNEDERTIITLVTGKVKVSIERQEPYFLEPGTQILYAKKDHLIEKKKVDVENAIAWRMGVLLFDKDDYSEARKKLERWYGVSIRTIGSPPSDFVITGQIGHNESLEHTLESLSFGRKFEFSINGKEIEIAFHP